jgi:hypothetical protein
VCFNEHIVLWATQNKSYRHRLPPQVQSTIDWSRQLLTLVAFMYLICMRARRK